MAFLRTWKKNGSRYYAVVRNDRRRDKVVQRVMEWLGRDPEPERLQRALRYWRATASVRVRR